MIANLSGGRRADEPRQGLRPRRTHASDGVCGFGGAQKTTLLRHLPGEAAAAGEIGASTHWAAVVSDVATVNIDDAVVGADGAAEVAELGGGCVCRSGADDLGEAVAGLAASGFYAHIWVETSGVANPRDIATPFTRNNPFGKTLSHHARLAARVTMGDVVAFTCEATRAEVDRLAIRVAWRQRAQRSIWRDRQSGTGPFGDLLGEAGAGAFPRTKAQCS